VNTKVERVDAPFPLIGFESHYFLRIDGTSAGFWPKGGVKKLLSIIPEIWVRGHVYSADPMSGNKQTSEFVWLDNCEYDVEKFRNCIKEKAKDHDEGWYNLLLHNCWHWREKQIEKCLKASKRSK
jgi:hypothetical protein